MIVWKNNGDEIVATGQVTLVGKDTGEYDKVNSEVWRGEKVVEAQY